MTEQHVLVIAMEMDCAEITCALVELDIIQMIALYWYNVRQIAQTFKELVIQIAHALVILDILEHYVICL